MAAGTKALTIVGWAALFWMLTWFPLYTSYWGWRNMLHLCDVSVVVACMGLFLRQPLLVSSQALLAPLVGVLWTLDVGWRIVTGHHLVGGTEYMWDANYPVWVRLLSCFHIVLPLVLLWVVRELGYDRRALLLQTAIASALLIVSRFLSPQLNMNYAFQDPLLHRAWGPPPVHLAVILGGCVVIFLWPTHLVLRRTFPAPRTGEMGANPEGKARRG